MQHELLKRFGLHIRQEDDGLRIWHQCHPFRSEWLMLLLLFLLFGASAYAIATELLTHAQYDVPSTLLFLFLLCTCLLCLYKMLSILTDHLIVLPGEVIYRRFLIRRRVDLRDWKLEVRSGAGSNINAFDSLRNFNTLTFYVRRGEMRRRVLKGRAWREGAGAIRREKQMLIKLLRRVSADR